MSSFQQTDHNTLARTIHVAPLHAKLNNEILRSTFTKYCGHVTRVALIDGRQSGLVEFKSKEGAEEALKLKGTKLTEANFAFTVHPEATTNTIDKVRSEASRTVYIPCFPASIDIISFFEKRCGPVQQCSTKVTACAYGFVEFEKIECVEIALNTMAGSIFPELGAEALKIRPAKTSIQQFPRSSTPIKVVAPRPSFSSSISLSTTNGKALIKSSSPSTMPMRTSNAPDSRKPRAASNNALSRTIHVAPLQPGLSEELLCSVFQERCGPVVRGFLVDGRQSGLVEFVRPETAAEALKLKGMQFTDGHLTFTLHPEPTTNTIGRGNGLKEPGHASRTIYIPCFPANMELSAFFEKQCGPVSRTKSTITACAYGFVEFQSVSSIDKALALVGKVVEDLSPEPLKVTRAKTSIEDKVARPLTPCSTLLGSVERQRLPFPLNPDLDTISKHLLDVQLQSKGLHKAPVSAPPCLSACSHSTPPASIDLPQSRSLPTKDIPKGDTPTSPVHAPLPPPPPLLTSKAADGEEAWQTQLTKSQRRKMKHTTDTTAETGNEIANTTASTLDAPHGEEPRRPHSNEEVEVPEQQVSQSGQPQDAPHATVADPMAPMHPNGSSSADPLTLTFPSTANWVTQCTESSLSAFPTPCSLTTMEQLPGIVMSSLLPSSSPSASFSSSSMAQPSLIPSSTSTTPSASLPNASTDALFSNTWIYNLFQIVGTEPTSATSVQATPTTIGSAVSTQSTLLEAVPPAGEFLTLAPKPPSRSSSPFPFPAPQPQLLASVPMDFASSHHMQSYIIAGADMTGIIGAPVQSHPHQAAPQFLQAPEHPQAFLSSSLFQSTGPALPGYVSEMSAGAGYLFGHLGNGAMLDSWMTMGMDAQLSNSGPLVAPNFHVGYDYPLRGPSGPLCDDVWSNAPSMASAFGGSF